MRTRQRPNSCEEAGIRKRRQPTLLTTPAERHQGEERENEDGCNHGRVDCLISSLQLRRKQRSGKLAGRLLLE